MDHEPTPNDEPTGEHDAVDADDPARADDWWSDEPQPEHRPAGIRSRRNVIIAVVGAAAIGAAAVAGVSVIGSSGGSSTAAAGVSSPNRGAGGPAVAGTIASISGSTISLKTQSGQATTVVTAGSTTVSKAAQASLSDVKVGDHVLVMGTGTTTVAAQRITDIGTNSGPGGPPNGSAGGSSGNGASGGSGSGGPGGQQGAPAGGPPSGSAGGSSGSGASNGASGGSGSGGPGGQQGAGTGGPPNGGGVMGTVASIDGSSLKITAPNGTTVTVTTSSSTTVSTVQQGSLRDLAVGQQVVVLGTTSNGTVSATSIREGVMDAGPGAGGASGTPPSSS